MAWEVDDGDEQSWYNYEVQSVNFSDCDSMGESESVDFEHFSACESESAVFEPSPVTPYLQDQYEEQYWYEEEVQSTDFYDGCLGVESGSTYWGSNWLSYGVPLLETRAERRFQENRLAEIKAEQLAAERRFQDSQSALERSTGELKEMLVELMRRRGISQVSEISEWSRPELRADDERSSTAIHFGDKLEDYVGIDDSATHEEMLEESVVADPNGSLTQSLLESPEVNNFSSTRIPVYDDDEIVEGDNDVSGEKRKNSESTLLNAYAVITEHHNHDKESLTSMNFMKYDDESVKDLEFGRFSCVEDAKCFDLGKIEKDLACLRDGNVHDELLIGTRKIMMPRNNMSMFNGDNPSEWLRECEKFFGNFFMTDQEKIDTAELCLGRAKVWYNSETYFRKINSWDDFKPAVLKRFGMQYDNNSCDDGARKLHNETDVSSVTHVDSLCTVKSIPVKCPVYDDRRCVEEKSKGQVYDVDSVSYRELPESFVKSDEDGSLLCKESQCKLMIDQYLNSQCAEVENVDYPVLKCENVNASTELSAYESYTVGISEHAVCFEPDICETLNEKSGISVDDEGEKLTCPVYDEFDEEFRPDPGILKALYKKSGISNEVVEGGYPKTELQPRWKYQDHPVHQNHSTKWEACLRLNDEVTVLEVSSDPNSEVTVHNPPIHHQAPGTCYVLKQSKDDEELRIDENHKGIEAIQCYDPGIFPKFMGCFEGIFSVEMLQLVRTLSRK